MASLQDPIIKFKELIDFIINLFPESTYLSVFTKILDVKLRVSSASWLIENVGPFFYKLREHIDKEDEKFYSSYNLTPGQIKDIQEFFGGYADNIISGFIEYAMLNYRKLFAEKKQLVFKVTKSILKIYCQYLLMQLESQNPNFTK